VKLRTLLLGHHDERAVARISEALDRMDHRNRLFTVLSAEKEDMQALWELMKDRPVDADHFVPGSEPLKEVIHHGKNSLVAFTRFQKRFCRADDDSGDIYGYNHNEPWLMAVTGPGYFVAHSTADEKEPPSSYVIDYTRLPVKKPESWPSVVDNAGLIRGLVYGRMKDYMRKVSDHVSIGKAYKQGDPVGAYFVLCREDPA
jgi:hypothetical protein